MTRTLAIILLCDFDLVPSLAVDVQHNGGNTIYAGSVLTLTCRIVVFDVPANLGSGVTVTTTWFGASGNPLNSGVTITVNPAMGSIDTVYFSTVVFNTVRTNNGGTFTCQATATHSSEFITDVTTPGEVTISPVGECNQKKCIVLRISITYTINICRSHSGTDCDVQYHSSSQCEPLQHLYPHLHCHCTNGCR